MGFSVRDVVALGRARREKGLAPLFPMTGDVPASPRQGPAPAADRHCAGTAAVTAGVRVLACDPSSQKFGWGVLEPVGPGRIVRHASGRITPSKAATASDQYTQLVENLNAVIDRHDVGALVFEVPTGNAAYRMRGMSAASYGRAVEIPHAIAVLRKINWRAIDVATWKGDTRKDYTAGLVRRLLAYEARWEDEADALGLGCWFLLRHCT